MDPKASSQLDPKLQEAYDRVMGVATNLNQPVATLPSPAVNPSMPASNVPLIPLDPTANPTLVPPPAQPDPAMPQILGTTPTIETPTVPPTPVIDPMEPSQPKEMVKTPPQPVMNSMENTASIKSHAFVAGEGKGVKVSPVIWVVGAIAFLLVYTVVWIKVFNLPVPFINQ